MILIFLVSIPFYFFLNQFFIKHNILIDKTETSIHKSKVSTMKNTPLTGGLIFIIILFFTPVLESKFLMISIIFIYILGLLSDLNIISSPLKRIFFQCLIIVFLVLSTNLEIKTISIDFFDKMLEMSFFNTAFLLLCILVLINGSNFLDGLNTLLVVYFIICLTAMYVASNFYNLQLDFELIKNTIIIFFIIFLFNFFGKSFLGDSGSYAISLFVGVICVQFIYKNSQVVSPYFIAILLWYPAIENLFSIIRRINSKRNFSSADNLHLHHLIYQFIKARKFFNNQIITNSVSGILINLYNFFIILISLFFLSNSKILVTLILANISIYLIIYLFLRKLKFK
tara:strand:+ start:702 stop:1724 length:1023 start_codon:yes stop_codon:yes gene_type:complete